MGYFQSTLKQNGIKTAGLIMVFALVLGCSTFKSEKPADKGSSAQAVSGDMAVEPGKRALTSVRMDKGENTLEVWVTGDGPLEYTSIKQDFPFAIAVYLPDTRIPEGLSPQAPDDPNVSGLRLGYADKNETTAKLEILLKKDLPYTVQEGENTLGILLQNPLAQEAEITIAEAPEQPVSQSDVQPSPIPRSEPVQVSDKRARMTHIEFDTAPSGRSDIRIKTSHPVRYEARQAGADAIHLILFNTSTPKIHQRPLLTRYFNSAVERIQPKPLPGSDTDSYVEITIREQVPYRLIQNRDGIYMGFEASSVKAPEFDKAKVGMNRSASTAPMQAGPVQSMPVSAGPSGGAVAPSPEAAPEAMAGTGSTVEDSLLGKPVQYTGEKIKLDFYDTDIKNVFRILRSISGLNFAIDEDVKGKVTMSLEEPVPWDQVMDLVLKMNGLGKKMEGNVVRIATLGTMAKEEKELQDAITARKKSMEQQESLAPLVTEYIPINYSDATADIQPHVAQILTPERGRISVDQRTNMIIITDTQAKIDQAHELIYRLDTVTPQIMIEARVVEVTKEFSRDLGVRWAFTNDPSFSAGFVDDFNMTVNQPAAGLASAFSFYRIFGSSWAALNAQLEAREQEGDVRIVSSPRILTLDNKKAKIKQGLEYAYLERDDSGGSSVKFKDIDLLLEVTPHVTPDKRIAMTVLLTKNDVAGVTASGVPTLATNEAETELLVNNNDTVVIGGVVKTTSTKDNSGIPYLTGIPILSQIFGVKQEVDNRNELLIFLTPSIVQLEQRRAGHPVN